MKQYPNWGKGLPNLRTFLTAINRSQPIIGSQFELVWSRWPRTIFFAKNITIPGVSVNTIDLNHAGFTIPIPTHATYENTEISMNIIADKEGFHYYDIRNMVLQSGHPLVAGDPRAAVGNQFGIDTSEDTLKIRLRNKPTDETHHFWTIHNFHPIGIGDMELSMDSASFVEFELKGTFTHITYKCGDMPLPDDPNDFSFGDTDNNGVIDSDDPNDFSFGPGVDDEVERPKDNFNNEPYDNPEEQYMGDDNDQEEELPEDWKYMSDDDK